MRIETGPDLEAELGSTESSQNSHDVVNVERSKDAGKEYLEWSSEDSMGVMAGFKVCKIQD